MCLILTNIDDKSTLPIVRVALSSVVFDIVDAGISVHEIVVLFHCI